MATGDNLKNVLENEAAYIQQAPSTSELIGTYAQLGCVITCSFNLLGVLFA